MCLQYYSPDLAGMCIHLAAKWSGQLVPDEKVPNEKLESVSDWDHFLRKCPSGLRNKILTSERKRSSKRKGEEISPMPRKKVLHG